MIHKSLHHHHSQFRSFPIHFFFRTVTCVISFMSRREKVSVHHYFFLLQHLYHKLGIFYPYISSTESLTNINYPCHQTLLLFYSCLPLLLKLVFISSYRNSTSITGMFSMIAPFDNSLPPSRN